MTTVYLVRHAEAEGNLYRRVHGWYNSLITDNGYRQIAALRGRFADIHIDAVYSSDLFRTMTTAKAVYLSHGLELHTDPGLREISLGAWEDKPWGEVYHFDGDRIALFNRSDPTWQAGAVRRHESDPLQSQLPGLPGGGGRDLRPGTGAA